MQYSSMTGTAFSGFSDCAGVAFSDTRLVMCMRLCVPVWRMDVCQVDHFPIHIHYGKITLHKTMHVQVYKTNN